MAIDPNKCRGSKSGHKLVVIREYDKDGYHWEVKKCVYGDTGEYRVKKGRSKKK